MVPIKAKFEPRIAEKVPETIEEKVNDLEMGFLAMDSLITVWHLTLLNSIIKDKYLLDCFL